MKTKTKNDRKKAANAMQLWRTVDDRKMAKVYGIPVPVFSAAEMAKGRKVGLFRQGKKGWSTLEEAKAACIREIQIMVDRYDHARKFGYPPYSVKWTSRLSERFSAIWGATIWDLRGEQPKPIKGWVAAYRPAKKARG